MCNKRHFFCIEIDPSILLDVYVKRAIRDGNRDIVKYLSIGVVKVAIRKPQRANLHIRPPWSRVNKYITAPAISEPFICSKSILHLDLVKIGGAYLNAAPVFYVAIQLARALDAICLQGTNAPLVTTCMAIFIPIKKRCQPYSHKLGWLYRSISLASTSRCPKLSAYKVFQRLKVALSF